LQPCQQEKAQKYYFFFTSCTAAEELGEANNCTGCAAKKTRHGIAAPGQSKGGVVMMAQPAARCQPRHPEGPESRDPGSPKPEQLFFLFPGKGGQKGGQAARVKD